jgi:hypothetical protein
MLEDSPDAHSRSLKENRWLKAIEKKFVAKVRH